jgi:hypothetical protein
MSTGPKGKPPAKPATSSPMAARDKAPREEILLPAAKYTP